MKTEKLKKIFHTIKIYVAVILAIDIALLVFFGASPIFGKQIASLAVRRYCNEVYPELRNVPFAKYNIVSAKYGMFQMNGNEMINYDITIDLRKGIIIDERKNKIEDEEFQKQWENILIEKMPFQKSTFSVYLAKVSPLWKPTNTYYNCFVTFNNINEDILPIEISEKEIQDETADTALKIMELMPLQYNVRKLRFEYIHYKSGAYSKHYYTDIDIPQNKPLTREDILKSPLKKAK